MTTERSLKLGKRPARPGAVRLMLGSYLRRQQLPVPPAAFDYTTKAASDWGMLANDEYGDCVLAGGAHEHLLWAGIAGVPPPRFTPAAVLGDYATITGFSPDDPNTDQGTDMELAAKYRRHTGLIDADGKRHKVGAYVGIRPGHLAEHKLASWMFGAVGIGLVLGDPQLDQFEAGKPWSGSPGDDAGGHYVPLMGFDPDGMLLVVTWGKVHRIDPAYFQRYNDESLVYFSSEMLRDNLGPTGLDVAALNADLRAVTRVA